VRFLDDYYIGRYPVTVRQFAAFVKATGHQTQAERAGTGWVLRGPRWRNVRGADWQHPYGPNSDVAGRADHPVTLVSGPDAEAFCRWVSAATGYRVGLPSELEWEKAARGPDGRLWPWGDDPPDATRCNFGGHLGDTASGREILEPGLGGLNRALVTLNSDSRLRQVEPDQQVASLDAVALADADLDDAAGDAGGEVDERRLDPTVQHEWLVGVAGPAGDRCDDGRGDQDMDGPPAHRARRESVRVEG
jgi:formylglycine-generating enzyme required for sulfatase activity